MTISIIDTENDGTAAYTQVTELEGVDYEFTFRYNQNDSHWYLTLRTDAGEQIKGCEGVRLVQGGLPLKNVTDTNRPPGELYIYGPSAEEPGLYDLGEDTVLIYVPEADVPS